MIYNCKDALHVRPFFINVNLCVSKKKKKKKKESLKKGVQKKKIKVVKYKSWTRKV